MQIWDVRELIPNEIVGIAVQKMFDLYGHLVFRTITQGTLPILKCALNEDREEISGAFVGSMANVLSDETLAEKNPIIVNRQFASRLWEVSERLIRSE